MLTKMVNGKEVICSDEEEKNILAYWAFNTTYPEFEGACSYDGKNPPYENIDVARRIYIHLCNEYYQAEIEALTLKIEMAREDGDDSLVKDLLAKRKECRGLMNPDVSGIETIEELHKMLPARL